MSDVQTPRRIPCYVIGASVPSLLPHFPSDEQSVTIGAPATNKFNTKLPEYFLLIALLGANLQVVWTDCDIVPKALPIRRGVWLVAQPIRKLPSI